MSAKNNPLRALRTLALTTTATLLTAAVFMIAGPASAQDDLSDPETCLMCHADMERDTSNQRVHNPDGSIKQEPHQMFACIDCHTNIEEIPHPEGTKAEVDCLTCHESEPEVQ